MPPTSTFMSDVPKKAAMRSPNPPSLQPSSSVTTRRWSASSALSVSRLLEYGDEVVDKPVKVSGTVQAGSLKAAGEGDRFVLADPDSGKTLPVAFDGALSDEIAEGSSLVVTGSLSADGKFAATDVALEG